MEGATVKRSGGQLMLPFAIAAGLGLYLRKVNLAQLNPLPVPQPSAGSIELNHEWKPKTRMKQEGAHSSVAPPDFESHLQPARPLVFIRVHSRFNLID